MCDDMVAKRKRHRDDLASPVDLDVVCHFESIPSEIVVVILQLACNKRTYHVCKQWLMFQLQFVFPPGGKREGEPRFGEGLRHALKHGHMDYYRKWCDQHGSWRPSAWGNAFLYHMVRHGTVDVVQRLLQMPSVLRELCRHDGKNQDVLGAAVRGTSVRLVELLLPHVDLAQCGAGALEDAATAGHLNIAKLLVAHGVKPSHRTLMAACNCYKDTSALVFYLLRECGLVVTPAEKSAALQLATRNNFERTAIILLGHGRADPSTNNNEAILNASEHGLVRLVQLMSRDARVDVVAVLDALNARNHRATLLMLLAMDYVRDALTRARIIMVVTISSDGSYEFRKSAMAASSTV